MSPLHSVLALVVNTADDVPELSPLHIRLIHRGLLQSFYAVHSHVVDFSQHSMQIHQIYEIWESNYSPHYFGALSR